MGQIMSMASDSFHIHHKVQPFTNNLTVCNSTGHETVMYAVVVITNLLETYISVENTLGNTNHVAD